MYGMELQAKIRSATATRKTDSEGDIADSTAIRLAIDYNPTVAGGLGERGVLLQKALGDGAMKSAVLDLKGIDVVVVMGSGKEKVQLKEAQARSLRLQAPRKEGAVPVATLTIKLPTTKDHLLYFVDRLDEVVEFRVDPKQGQLAV